MKAVTGSLLISFSLEQSNPAPLASIWIKGWSKLHRNSPPVVSLIPVCQQVSSLSTCLLHWWGPKLYSIPDEASPIFKQRAVITSLNQTDTFLYIHKPTELQNSGSKKHQDIALMIQTSKGNILVLLFSMTAFTPSTIRLMRTACI